MADQQESKSSAEGRSTYDVSKLPIEEPEDGVFAAYSNIFNADWTLHDIRIRFGELMQVPRTDSSPWDDQRGIILERAAITLPWHQAKTLCKLLEGVIKNYEEINGELKPLKLPAAPK